jgi:hypothetical protein
MKDLVKFEIKMLPVSENKAVGRSSRGGYKTNEYKEWEEFVLLTVKEKTIAYSEWYESELIFHFPLYYKNGKIKVRDGHNFIKYAIDTVLHNKVVDENGERIDDSRVIGGNWYKVDDKEEWVEITFYCVGEC